MRTIVRLNETCREFRNAAAMMGSPTLHKKMEAASNAIKRDCSLIIHDSEVFGIGGLDRAI